MEISADERRQAFSIWLRTGRLPRVKGADGIEIKFNPWHDPENGRFTFANTGRYFGRRGSGGFTGGGGGSSGGGHRALENAITADQIRLIMPNAGLRAAQFVEHLNLAMNKNGISLPSQKAAFLAHISVESNELRSLSENLDYSAQRLTEVWPGRFPTIASALPYAHNPQALGNFVYANRLGNGDVASGDGYRFRGGGLMQTTGRDNYRAIGFENNPDALRTPSVAATSASEFWVNNGLNEATSTTLNRAQFNATTRVVNGGYNGASERWAAYQRARSALGLMKVNK